MSNLCDISLCLFGMLDYVFIGGIHGISIASLCIVLLDIFLMHIFVSTGVIFEMNGYKLESIYVTGKLRNNA